MRFSSAASRRATPVTSNHRAATRCHDVCTVSTHTHTHTHAHKHIRMMMLTQAGVQRRRHTPRRHLGSVVPTMSSSINAQPRESVVAHAVQQHQQHTPRHAHASDGGCSCTPTPRQQATSTPHHHSRDAHGRSHLARRAAPAAADQESADAHHITTTPAPSAMHSDSGTHSTHAPDSEAPTSC